MTVLVTGGAGFIGSALVRSLIRDGADVVTVDKFTYAGSRENLAEANDRAGHRVIEADIADLAMLREVFRSVRPQIVYHLAAESHVDRSIDAPALFVRTNVVGTFNLLQAALEYWQDLPADTQLHFRFIAVSTDEVFGDLMEAPPASETSPYRPSSPYAASKAGSDHLVRAWSRTYGLPVIVSNCTNNYGPFQFPEKLIPTVILAALDGRPIPLYGDGANVRDWLHVDDHVAALRLIADRGTIGATYLIGARCEKNNREVVERLCAALDELAPTGQPHRRLITAVADRPGHDLRYALDPSRVERELGWRPHVDFDQGLRATVAWYLTHRDWCRRALARKDGPRQHP